jgi:hypothetical protein
VRYLSDFLVVYGVIPFIIFVFCLFMIVIEALVGLFNVVAFVFFIAANFRLILIRVMFLLSFRIFALVDTRF